MEYASHSIRLSIRKTLRPFFPSGCFSYVLQKNLDKMLFKVALFQETSPIIVNTRANWSTFRLQAQKVQKKSSYVFPNKAFFCSGMTADQLIK